MNSVQVVIRKLDQTVINFKINENHLAGLVTNKNLYEKNIEFIDDIIEKYGDVNDNQIPVEKGIIFIDLVNELIFDSQTITGINKISPSEILVSKGGNLFEDDSSLSIIKRFKDLVQNGYLKCFEQWDNHGTHTINKFNDMGINEILTNIDNAIYGQFVFNTNNFKIYTFLKNDLIDQQTMFNKVKALHILTDESIGKWKIFLSTLK